MNHSDKLDQIGPALLKVQESVGGVEKNSANPHFKSRYADLSATNAATRDALCEAGVHVSQWPGAYDREQNKMAMTTFLLHAASGQWMRETAEVPLSKADAQGYGSATTYARRYALQAALGLSPEDDDGNAAVRPNGKASNDTGEVIDDHQWATLTQLIEASNSDTRRFCAYMGVSSLKDIRVADFARAVSALQSKIKPEQEAA